jgi:hypothetical protein
LLGRYTLLLVQLLLRLGYLIDYRFCHFVFCDHISLGAAYKKPPKLNFWRLAHKGGWRTSR